MDKTITLTDEQYKALQDGESITIEPPKPEKWEPDGGKWEPDGGKWVMCADNTPFRLSARPMTILAGRVRKTKELAERAAAASCRRDRLEAFRDQYWPDWEADWSDERQRKWSLYFYHKTGDWCHRLTYNSEEPGVVYGPKEFAEKACEMLNNGELEL